MVQASECKQNCDARQNGINVTRKIESVRAALGERDHTPRWVFPQEVAFEQILEGTVGI